MAMTKPALVQQTEQVLEWHQLLEAVANEAASSMGGELCRVLPFAQDLEMARVQQQETFEMVQMLEGSSPLLPLNFPDIRLLLARAAKGGLLEGMDLRDISLVLAMSQSASQWLEGHCEACPTVSKRSVELQELSRVRRTIDHCVDAQGHLRESASPMLHQFTQKSQSLRQAMRRRLEHLLSSQQYEERLQGQYFAERENRYVIPVKAERQHEVDGIIHDISSSGATVFIEPRNLIELNNAIKFADLQVSQETRRILQDLSNTVAESVLPIQKTLQQLAELDCLVAKARLSRKIEGCSVHLNQIPRIHLLHAKHPLLVLTKDSVVANTVHIDEDIHTLIISGPNAGGKTVTMKLVGLIALMVKVGLLPPCAPDSEMAFFEEVYADIGDTQDLSRDLSSFSGHILSLIALLDDLQSHTTVSPHSSLVMLDEVGSSTDPIEGAALAEAILSRLSELGCISIVTTHYPSLKTLAYRNPHVRNASQEFNMERLSPTYRLIDGIPGGSSALEIADRLGLEASILQAARELIQGEDQDLDHVFQRLQDTYTHLEEERTQTQTCQKEAQRLFEEAHVLREQLSMRERDDRQRYRQQWQREFSKAQRQVNHIIETLKKENTPSQVKTMRRSLAHLDEHIKGQLPVEGGNSLIPPKPGDRVKIGDLGTVGILQENPEGKKLVSIRVGAQTIKIAPSAVRVVSSSHSKPKHPPQTRRDSLISSQNSIASSVATGTYQHEHDLRGTRLEDALEVTAAALDQALLKQAQYVKLIHGQGSGALKTGIRKFCQSSPYIKNFRAGDLSEGGDGVTIIELR
ncbi:MAG: endonuclease MutS2 [Nitrospirota bacterium]|nr:endonuclease MutS2 [Nitrospirota bacterium]